MIVTLTSCVTSVTVMEQPLKVLQPGITTTYSYFNENTVEILTDEDKSRSEIRAERVAVLEKLHEETNDLYKKPNILIKLADEQYQYALDLKAQAETKHGEQMHAYRIGELSELPKPDLRSYNEALTKHVNLLRTFSNTYQNDFRRKQVFLSMAISMAELNHDLCENYFTEAGKGLKEKEDILKFKIARAGWFVKINKWDEAKELYTSVMKEVGDSNNDLKAYASFRLGHVFLAKNDKKKALIAFKVAYLTDTREIQRQFDLKKETLLNLAQLWAGNAQVDEAKQFAEDQHLKNFMKDYQEFYAQELVKSGKPDQAIEIWRDQIKSNPLASNVPRLKLEIALAYLQRADVDASNREIQEMKNMTIASEDPWYKEHGEDPVILNYIERIVKSLPFSSGFKMIEIGLESEDQKDKTKFLNAGINLLNNSLGQLKDSAKKISIYQNLIRAYTQLNQQENILNQLDKLMVEKENPEVNRKDVAFQRLKILSEIDEKSEYSELPPMGEVKQPLVIPVMKQRYLSGIEEYLSLDPEFENKINLKYQVANTYFQYGHYSKALQLMENLTIEAPRSEEGVACMQIIVSMAGQKKQFDEVVRLATNLLNNRQVKGKAIRDFLKESLDWAKSQGGNLAH